MNDEKRPMTRLYLADLGGFETDGSDEGAFWSMGRDEIWRENWEGEARLQAKLKVLLPPRDAIFGLHGRKKKEDDRWYYR
jgi:hypothetical protein